MALNSGGGPLGALLQLFSALAALGCLAAGAIQLNGVASLGLAWCSSSSSSSNNNGGGGGGGGNGSNPNFNPDCWLGPGRVSAAAMVHAFVLVLSGAYLTLAELRFHRCARPPSTISLLGILALGAAGNTGLVAGGAALAAGLLQLIGARAGHEIGPLVLGVQHAALDVLHICRAALTLALVAVAACGVLVIRIASDVTARNSGGGGGGGGTGGDPAALSWCVDTGSVDCWFVSRPTDFGLGTYGAALALTGVVGAAAAAKLVTGLEELLPPQVLGPFAIVAGAVALPAAGNSGLVAGVTTMAVGFAMWLSAGFLDAREATPLLN